MVATKSYELLYPSHNSGYPPFRHSLIYFVRTSYYITSYWRSHLSTFVRRWLHSMTSLRQVELRQQFGCYQFIEQCSGSEISNLSRRLSLFKPRRSQTNRQLFEWGFGTANTTAPYRDREGRKYQCPMYSVFCFFNHQALNRTRYEWCSLDKLASIDRWRVTRTVRMEWHSVDLSEAHRDSPWKTIPTFRRWYHDTVRVIGWCFASRARQGSATSSGAQWTQP